MTDVSFSRGIARCATKKDENFIINFHRATDEIFSLDWLLYGKEPKFTNIEKPQTDETIPSWADSLIHLVSDTTASTEQLRRENAQLRESIHELIEDNKILRQELLALVREMRLSSHINARYTTTPMQPIPKAAESNK